MCFCIIFIVKTAVQHALFEGAVNNQIIILWMESKMRIVIDGDGCPVVDETIKIAREKKLECIILCDTAHKIEKAGASTIVVSKGADSVDFALVNMLNKNDVVITQDYGLAAMCLAKGAKPLHQDGMQYTSENIDALLLARHTAKKIRRSGGRLKGSAKRVKAQDDKFVAALLLLIEQNITD